MNYAGVVEVLSDAHQQNYIHSSLESFTDVPAF